MVSTLGELSLRMSLGLPSVSLTGQGVGAGRGSPAAEAMPRGGCSPSRTAAGPTPLPAVLCWGPSSIPPASLCKRSPPWPEGAGASPSREEGKGSKVGVPRPPTSQEDPLLSSGPCRTPGIWDPAGPPKPAALLRQTGILGQGAQRQRRKETFSEEV